MYRPADYPELEGKEPEWVESEREMFKEHRDKDRDGKLNKAFKLFLINYIKISINLFLKSLLHNLPPFFNSNY